MPSILLHLQTFNDTLPLSTDNSYGLKLPQHLHRMADSSCDKKCSRDKWHETSFAVEVQKDHDILESSSCLLPCRPAHISGLGWHLTRRGSALTHSRRKKKKQKETLGSYPGTVLFIALYWKIITALFNLWSRMHLIPSQMLLFHHPALSKAAGQINGGCFYLGDGKAVNCNTPWNLIMQSRAATLQLLIRGLIQR